MAVLVTGGSGSIGAWTIHELVDRGVTPVVFDIKINRKYLQGVEDDIIIVEGDITDYESVSSAIKENDVDRVISLAKYLPPNSEENPLKALKVNVAGNGTVMKAATENGNKRFVFSSSKSAFTAITGEHGPPKFKPINEDYPKFDRTTEEHVPFYSVTNKMFEYYGIRYAMKEDMEFVFTRFGSTWGPGKLESYRKFGGPERSTGGALICQMIVEAANGGTLNSAQGKADNAVYTKDIAQGVAKAALSEDIQFSGNHREFLLDAGQVLSHTDFADALNEMFPDANIDVEEYTDNKTHRKGVQCVFDLTRSRNELGYEPKFAKPRDAINDYLETEEKFK